MADRIRPSFPLTADLAGVLAGVGEERAPARGSNVAGDGGVRGALARFGTRLGARVFWRTARRVGGRSPVPNRTG